LTPESEPTGSAIHRLIVVPLIFNSRGCLLICKMPLDRGVFPGEWGLPGGGVEPGESLPSALTREVDEELGMQIDDIFPLHFREGLELKHLGGGNVVPIHMVYLLFRCHAVTTDVRLNEEFVEFAWAMPRDLGAYHLNRETVATLTELGLIHSGSA
jgi:nucleoside triphosphatase